MKAALRAPLLRPVEFKAQGGCTARCPHSGTGVPSELVARLLGPHLRATSGRKRTNATGTHGAANFKGSCARAL